MIKRFITSAAPQEVAKLSAMNGVQTALKGRKPTPKHLLARLQTVIESGVISHVNKIMVNLGHSSDI